jgi:acetyl-CoA C-acetyltransferase
MNPAGLRSTLRTISSKSFSTPVYAVAGGLSIPGKARPDTVIEEQVCEAVRVMLHDNDLKINSPTDLQQYKGFVQSAYFSDHFEDQLLTSAIVQAAIGWNPAAGWRVEAGGGTGGCAVQAAAMAVASGVYDYAIVLGFEKMSMVSTPQATEFIALAADQTFDFSQGGNYTGFYAGLANEHISLGTTSRKQMAKVVVKNRNQAQFNGFAQTCHTNPFKTSSGSGFITIDEVLSDNRPSCAPIKPIDCSLMSDAASALLICSKELAFRLSDHPIRLAGIGAGTDAMRTGDRLREPGSLLRPGAFLQGRDLLLPHERENPDVVSWYGNLRYPSGHSFMAGRVAAIHAFEMAGITDPLKDIQWYEVHDAFSSAEIQAIEDFGLAPFGRGGSFIDTGDWDETRGRFRSDFPSFGYNKSDRVFINVSGGLIGARHGIGDTGVFQNVDTVWRLQGKIKKFYGNDAFQPPVKGGTKAADHSHGGTGAVVAVSIWERPEGLPSFEIDSTKPCVADREYQRITEQRNRVARLTGIRRPSPPARQSDLLSPEDPGHKVRYKNAAGASIIRSPYNIEYFKTRGRISPFFDGLQDQKLQVTYCPDHGVFIPPVAFCREHSCMRDISENWTDLAKEVGQIQTWSTMYYTGPSFKGELPFHNILVEYPGKRDLVDVLNGDKLENPVIKTSIMSRLVLPKWLKENDIYVGMPVIPQFNTESPTGKVTDMWYVPNFTKEEWESAIKDSLSPEMRASNSEYFYRAKL